MKITTLSVVLFLASSIVLADKKSTFNVRRDVNTLEKRVPGAIQYRPLALMKCEDPSSDKNGKEAKANGKDGGADKEEEGYED
ncbi:hypothetical protein BGX21_003151, partial [Mortierella sp. AD011]